MEHTSNIQPQSSIVHGATHAPLWYKTVGQLFDEQAEKYAAKPAAIFPWQLVRLSFSDINNRSKVVAMAMLDAGLEKGDTIGIMAGNCHQYLEVFVAGSRIGNPVCVLNNTYTPTELKTAIKNSNCKVLFLAENIGRRSLDDHLSYVAKDLVSDLASELRLIVSLGQPTEALYTNCVQSYETFTSTHSANPDTAQMLHEREKQTQPEDVANLQFTSGTTGDPKAAMLTHINILNNARFVGEAMQLTASDIVCCPPPLFHCFGLVIGFLASMCHGSCILFPSDQFDADAVLEAIYHLKATALLGVPTMFIAELDANQSKGYKIDTLRTGIAAGSAVPVSLMKRLQHEMGVDGILIAYGMTETSPVTFMSSLIDSMERRASTLGRVMPHTSAKIIDKDGNILARGQPGELCTSGYALQKGYYRNPERTRDVMKTDENGLLWMHTGDQCLIDEDGYCHVTGRMKDIIVRGGENISPVEVEERLLAHPDIIEASVVGIQDPKYGEVVGCFLKGRSRLDNDEIQTWARHTLGWHKAPRYVFWIGDEQVGMEFPKTGSGKHQKFALRKIGNEIIKAPGWAMSMGLK